ncbi:MAG: hypothetical protein Q7S08_04225 [bacterium]|nr:hypothetical protein [bacterium]
MQHISVHIKRTMSKGRETERGELMKYFCERINSGRRRDGLAPITMGRMGKTLEKIPTKDLYYLKSVCDQAENFSKKFWYSLNPEKYEKANKGKFASRKKGGYLMQ